MTEYSESLWQDIFYNAPNTRSYQVSPGVPPRLEENTMSDEKKTLYERLGGYNAITAVANDLLPRLQADPHPRIFTHTTLSRSLEERK